MTAADHENSPVAVLESALRKISEYGVSIIDGYPVVSADVVDIAREALAAAQQPPGEEQP